MSLCLLPEPWKENLKEIPKPKNGRKHGQNLYTWCSKWNSKQVRGKDAWYIQGKKLKVMGSKVVTEISYLLLVRVLAN